MSPAVLRRYRAERLLRREFEGLRERVLTSVRARLRARGVTLDIADLEECYASAWQGLYMALIEGQELENPTGWLTTVCFRRAIDEHRARFRERRLPDDAAERFANHEPDLAGALDDRIRLRQTFEGLRHLNAREQQAASLCYLQGLSRAEAATRMGISEARMGKLMEGRGPGHPGVARKVDELVQAIRGGGWCEQQGSLMRGYAFGMLDPDGERYRLAQMHQRECPACRAYVLSLRGMAAVLPPLALPLGPGMAGLGGILGAGVGAGAPAGAGAGSGALGSGALGTSAGLGGAVGGGAAGSWLPLGGSLAGKLVAGCLLVAGLGGGCVALIAGSNHTAHAGHRHDDVAGADPRIAAPVPGGAIAPATPSSRGSGARPASRSRSTRSTATATASGAERELGFERVSPTATPARTSAPAASPPRAADHARPSSSPSRPAHEAGSSSGSSRGAEREFGAG